MISGSTNRQQRRRTTRVRQYEASDTESIRCDHDGLKMAEIKDGHLILRSKHHGETHVKIVRLAGLVG